MLLAPIRGAQMRLQEAKDLLADDAPVTTERATEALQKIRASSMNCYIFDALPEDSMEVRASLMTQEMQLADPCTFRIILKNITQFSPAAERDAAQEQLTALLQSYRKLDTYLEMLRDGYPDELPRAREQLNTTLQIAANVEGFVKRVLQVA